MPGHLRLAAESTGSDHSLRPESPTRVVLADDHTVVRRSLRLLLDVEADVEVVAEAADLAAVIGHLHSHSPHVLVISLRLRDGSSIETVRRLRAQVPGTEVVLLTMEESPAFAQQVFDAGALGFVLMDRADSELHTAIRRAARGEAYVSSRVGTGLATLQRAVGGEGLSPRETEVLRLIAFGHTNAEIAVKLHLSRRTVETARCRIHRKLGLTTRAELVKFALRRHLIGA